MNASESFYPDGSKSSTTTSGVGATTTSHDGQDHPVGGVETDARGWPILHASDHCDGLNPMTGRACRLGYHKGYHRDASGAEWVDDE